MGKLMTCQGKLIDLLTAQTTWFFVPAEPETNPNAATLVPVISKRVGDIDAAILEKVESIGVCLVVWLNGAESTEPEIPTLDWDAHWTLSAIENVLLNATGKTAEDIIEKAAATLHYAPNGVVTGDDTIASKFLCERRALRPVAPPPKKLGLNIQVLAVTTNISIK